jgi:predicted extracellular nuclease
MEMRKLAIIASIVAIAILLAFSCKTSKDSASDKFNEQLVRDSYRIMFFNTENLFDTIDNPDTKDDEFTPQGAKFWTGYRYNTKLSNLSKVIIGAGGWELPQIVALSEIENRKVVEDLINKTPLRNSDYRIIHKESPDARGIDVAMMYRKRFFSPISENFIPVKYPANIGSGTTRDILYVKGTTNRNDTLHIFVNHWPSRWGGQMETEEKRIFVAGIVKHTTDSIFKTNKNANIVIVGDLNDYPTDKSLIHGLKTETEFDKIKSDKLYNLSYYLQEVKKLGTHKFHGQWGILDQVIVSGALLDTTNTIHTTKDDAHIYNPDFMLMPDEGYTGKQVFRTYVGYKYQGGYSDHLPTYIDLNWK